LSTARTLALALLLAAIATTGMAPDEPGERDPARLWLAHARTCLGRAPCVQASFTQETIHALGGSAPTSSGKALACRGGRLRLEYLEPDRRILVSDGVVVRAWHPETATFYESPARTDEIIAAFAILSEGEPEARRGRFVGGSRDPAEGGRGVVELEVADNPVVARAVATFGPRCPALERVTLIDRAGTATRLTFSGFEEILGAPARRFVMKPPKGAVVVRP